MYDKLSLLVVFSVHLAIDSVSLSFRVCRHCSVFRTPHSFWCQSLLGRVGGAHENEWDRGWRLSFLAHVSLHDCLHHLLHFLISSACVSYLFFFFYRFPSTITSHFLSLFSLFLSLSLSLSNRTGHACGGLKRCPSPFGWWTVLRPHCFSPLSLSRLPIVYAFSPISHISTLRPL